VIDISTIPVATVRWRGAVRIIRSLYPPIDLFEDIADPADWALIISAERKTNPRLMETIGNLDLVPAARRVSGPGASYLMAPFTHASADRPSRFSKGAFGVFYVADRFDAALFETIHRHARFMAATNEAPGWTSQFREIVLDVNGRLQNLRGPNPDFAPVFHPDDYSQSQILGSGLHAKNSEGVVYPSQRLPQCECVGLFFPDLASNPRQGRHLDYHWNGDRVDYYRNAEDGQVFQVVLSRCSPDENSSI
jgi:hypothetical protein